MPLPWNEIRDKAIAFSREWQDAESERADAQTFWNEFFAVFGVPRRRVASFEEPVRILGTQRAGNPLIRTPSASHSFSVCIGSTRSLCQRAKNWQNQASNEKAQEISPLGTEAATLAEVAKNVFNECVALHS